MTTKLALARVRGDPWWRRLLSWFRVRRVVSHVFTGVSYDERVRGPIHVVHWRELACGALTCGCTQPACVNFRSRPAPAPTTMPGQGEKVSR